MAITEPLDLLSGFPGWSTSFEMLARQEQSRHASGRTRVKNFGSPLWQASYASKMLKPNALDHWRARLGASAVDQMTFLGRSLSRCRPMLHPGDSVLPAGVIHTIDDNNKAVRVDDLDGISLSVGDFVQIGGDLHQVLEAAVAVDGLTPLFELRPHLWPGVEVGDVVTIQSAACLMTIVPGSISATADPRTGRGSVSFSAIEARG